MVGIRSMGLALESLIGFEQEELGGEGMQVCMVAEWHLRRLLQVGNERFVENGKRIERFRELLKKGMEEMEVGSVVGKKGKDGEKWEDPKDRGERKRLEGLARRAEALKLKDTAMKEKAESGESAGTGDEDFVVMDNDTPLL